VKMTGLKYDFLILFFIFFAICFFAACGKEDNDNQQDELKLYITKLKMVAADQQIQIKPLAWQLPTPVVHQPNDDASLNLNKGVELGYVKAKASLSASFSSPPVSSTSSSSSSANATADFLSKNTTGPLRDFPVGDLQFIGVMAQDHHFLAYLMTNQGMVYLAKTGDAIGQEGGRIATIKPDHLEIEISNGRLLVMKLKK
jgi:hypothetical protein